MTLTYPNIDSFDFYIYPREVGANKCILLHNLGACILDAAGLAAAHRGFGMNDMHAQGKAWVVSRMMIDIVRMPKEYEMVTISTWVSQISTVTSTRLFCITDKEGNILATSSTYWSIIDIQTRRMVNLIETTNLKENIIDTSAELPQIVNPQRVDVPRNAMPQATHSHRVVYSDIDINCHVNSMKYLQWSIDTLSQQYLISHKLKQCHINFTHEALAEQNINIQHYNDTAVDTPAPHSHIFTLTNEENIVCCKILLIDN